MRSGILLIDKPAGMTSAGVVARVKRLLGAGRVGHAGTLDPDATGLLIILLQGATRVASYAADGYKIYSGEIQLGVRTSTDDLGGEILNQTNVIPAWEDVTAAGSRFVGKIQQVPPKVSAIKVQGKRAHKLHRNGASFELTAREVDVRRFDISQGDSPSQVRYVIECSPGTYVRSLARDLGEALGCGGAVSTIRRERSGHFSVSDAISIEEVSWSRVQDWAVLVPGLPRLRLPIQVARSLLDGQRRGLRHAWEVYSQEVSSEVSSHIVFFAEESQDSLGILKIQDGGGFEFELNIPPKTLCPKC